MHLKRFLRSISPSFWTMVHPYSASWDAALNRLLDDYQFTEISERTAKLNGVVVCIANYPYGAFTPCIPGKTEKVRPSRMTIVRAEELLRRSDQPRFIFDDIAQCRKCGFRHKI